MLRTAAPTATALASHIIARSAKMDSEGTNQRPLSAAAEASRRRKERILARSSERLARVTGGAAASKSQSGPVTTAPPPAGDAAEIHPSHDVPSGFQAKSTSVHPASEEGRHGEMDEHIKDKRPHLSQDAGLSMGQSGQQENDVTGVGDECWGTDRAEAGAEANQTPGPENSRQEDRQHSEILNRFLKDEPMAASDDSSRKPGARGLLRKRSQAEKDQESEKRRAAPRRSNLPSSTVFDSFRTAAALRLVMVALLALLLGDTVAPEPLCPWGFLADSTDALLRLARPFSIFLIMETVMIFGTGAYCGTNWRFVIQGGETPGYKEAPSSPLLAIVSRFVPGLAAVLNRMSSVAAVLRALMQDLSVFLVIFVLRAGSATLPQS